VNFLGGDKSRPELRYDFQCNKDKCNVCLNASECNHFGSNTIECNDFEPVEYGGE